MRINLQIVFMFVFLFTSCATLRELDQSQLNHKAMDLNAPLSAEKSCYLTPLGANSKSARLSGACATCAH